MATAGYIERVEAITTTHLGGIERLTRSLLSSADETKSCRFRIRVVDEAEWNSLGRPENDLLRIDVWLVFRLSHGDGKSFIKRMLK